jgi:type IV pilus assembly protein PilA
MKGFTLLELLLVVVIIGILALIAIPQLSNAKVKAYDAAAKNDLRNAMSAQEGFFSDYQTYAPLASLQLTTSHGVMLGWADLASGGSPQTGYMMTARHSGSPNTWIVRVGGSNTNQGKIHLCTQVC